MTADAAQTDAKRQLADLSAALGMASLTEWERKFIADVARFRRLTPKQLALVAKLHNRIDAATRAPQPLEKLCATAFRTVAHWWRTKVRRHHMAPEGKNGGANARATSFPHRRHSGAVAHFSKGMSKES